jgi:murein DD-endopeptidase MepM/ murein hydrolase activator NlpD
MAMADPDNEQAQFDEVKEVERTAASKAPYKGSYTSKSDQPAPATAKPAKSSRSDEQSARQHASRSNSRDWKDRNSKYSHKESGKSRHHGDNSERSSKGKKHKKSDKPKQPSEVTVQKGESLTKIAEKAGVSVKDIERANGIEDGNKIKAGEKIKIPTKAEAKQAEKKSKSSKSGKSGKGSSTEKSSKKSSSKASKESSSKSSKSSSGKSGKSGKGGKAEKNSAAPADSRWFEEDAADRKLSSSFTSNKGRLPMPITGSYSVVGHYGTYTVPGLRNVTLDNKGIDIRGQQGAQARAVFDGTVSSVFQYGGQYIIMVRHGQYISVYSGLQSVHVSKGAKVSTKQTLGNVGRNDDGHYVLHFQLRNQTARLNPEQWVR